MSEELRERAVETVARAIAAASDDNAFSEGDDGGREDRSEDREWYLRAAAAAIAALPPSPAEEAVKRVNLALATTSELEDECAKRGLDVRDPFALASPAPAPQGEEGQR